MASMFGSGSRSRPRAQAGKPQLPSIPSIPRPPKGYSADPFTARTQGAPGASSLRASEPAGEPPPSFLSRYPSATKPEWCVYWALTKRLGYADGEDFVFQAKLRGVEIGPFSTLDFLFSQLGVGIEIQGNFWHTGTDVQANDLARRAAFASEGYTVIAIDEDDAISNPIYYTKEALAFRSHSKITPG